jgi:hypothetical protein
MAKQVRQGHILLTPEVVPESAIPLKPNKENHIVLASGESGREHLFRSARVNLFQFDGSLFIEVIGDEPVILEHDEHGDIEVEPGTYRIVEQRELDDDSIGFGTRRSYD